jgi:hypothetical protein
MIRTTGHALRGGGVKCSIDPPPGHLPPPAFAPRAILKQKVGATPLWGVMCREALEPAWAAARHTADLPSTIHPAMQDDR